MKIFSALQIRECDKATILKSGGGSLALMEKAAEACVRHIARIYSKNTTFVVFCGPGNNGGDGLAITRMLHQRGYGTKAFLLMVGNQLSDDCQANLDCLQKLHRDLVTVLQPGTFISELPSNIVIIDAIFGTGLNRALTGWGASFIQHLNSLKNLKIAIDIPSGMYADALPDDDAQVFRTHSTLSFQFYKRSFLHPEASIFTGTVEILDIGLDADYIATTHTSYHTTQFADAQAIFKPRGAFGHKGTYGKTLVIGGSHGKIGSIALAAKAAVCAGAGTVTVMAPNCGYLPIQTFIPEAMCLTNGEHVLEVITGWDDFNAIGIGPGLGIAAKTVQAVADFLEACRKPIVLDADALNILSAHPELMGKLPPGSILTPHPKEFSRLFGSNTNSMIQTDNAKIQAMRYGVFIVLKGHHTAVVTPDGECHYNLSGNPGMATGGAGDVLTGIITSLLGQGYSSVEAAQLGVFLHGCAGDFAAAKLSQEAMRAGDIIDHLGNAFNAFKTATA